MTNATLSTLPALNTAAVEAFKQRVSAFQTLSLAYNYPQAEAATRFHAAVDSIEAKQNCTAIVHAPATPAEPNWLSTVTIADCQRALNTLGYIAAGAFVAMATVTICFLIGCYMAAVITHRGWVAHNMSVKAQAFATVTARAWVAGVSVLVFEGLPIVRALVAGAVFYARSKRQVRSLYPAS